MSAPLPRFAALVLALAAAPSGRAAEPAPVADSLRARLTFRACTSAVREDAVHLCRLALEQGLGPHRAAVAQRLLGRNLADLMRWDEAVAAYREALRLEPSDAEASSRLGLALYYGLDQAAAAEPYLGAAVRACPEEAAYHVDWAVVLNALGRPDDSATEFQAALALDPRALDARPAAQATYLASIREALWP